MGSRPAFGSSPRDRREEEIILAAGGHRNEAVEANAQVHHNPFEGCYEIRLDGRMAGFTVYKSKPKLIAFLHTDIDPSLEGRGLGSRLIGSALDDARERAASAGSTYCPSAPSSTSSSAATATSTQSSSPSATGWSSGCEAPPRRGQKGHLRGRASRRATFRT
jgi:predicted GNAT family acetyltransferase